MKVPKFMVHISALVLLIAYFGLAGLIGILTYRSVIRRINNYHYRESFINPRFLNEQLSGYLLSRFPERDGLVRELHSAIQVALGKKESLNFSVIKDDAGFLNSGDFYQLTNYSIKYYANRLRTLKESRIERENGYLLAIAGGDKFLPSVTPIYSGYPVTLALHRNMDEMLLRLMEYRVETLDLRSVFEKSAIDYTGIYYKTDRGWSAPAALEAAGAIAKSLGAKNNFAPENRDFLMDRASYREFYLKDYRGVYTQSVGHYFGGHDDSYVAMLPRFDTSFDFYESLDSYIPDKQGSFAETLFTLSYSDAEVGAENISPVFMGNVSAASPVRRVVNNHLTEGAKVLFVGGGDFVSTAAYFALLCGELVFLSPASPQFYNELLNLIGEGVFDYVLYGMEIDAIGEALFPFYTGN